MGIWRHGAGAMRPFVAAAPWLTVLILVLMLHVLSGTLTSAKGLLVDLPSHGLSDGERTELVAIITQRQHETLIFFNDARYIFDEPSSVQTFKEHLTEQFARHKNKSLLVLADRRVPTGTLMHFASVAKFSGAERLLFAEKQAEAKK
jgi:biopolymer transport protein ExbD